jgi:hypothetical protein
MQQSDFHERLAQYHRDQAERRRQSDERWQRLLAAVAEAGRIEGERRRALPDYRHEHVRPVQPEPQSSGPTSAAAAHRLCAVLFDWN